MSTNSLHDEWLADVKPARNVGGRPRERSDSDQRNRKLECVSCGFICRASAAAIRGAGAPSCGCGAGPLSVPLERDVAAIDPKAIGAGEARELERVARRDIARLEREANHGFARGAVPCGVCGRFKSKPADVCGFCGDEPATFGATDAETREAERVHNRAYGCAA